MVGAGENASVSSVSSSPGAVANKCAAIATQKGGTGKSTVAVNLSAGLARAGHRTLLIDADPQANSTYVLTGSQLVEPSLHDVIVANTASLPDILGSCR